MSQPSDPHVSLQDVLTYQLDERDIQLLEDEAAREETFDRGFADGRAELDVWKKAASERATDAPGLFERINQIQSVVAILRACLPEDKKLEQLESQTIEAAQHTAALNALYPETPGYVAHVAEIDQDLAKVEEALLALERRVPLSWLRHKTDEFDFGDVALAHYLRFQIQFLKMAPVSWSRIDLLISRLAATRDITGVFRLRGAEAVAELLSSCVPPSTTPDHVRESAIRFLDTAKIKLESLDGVDELFSSGIYVDILGYKLSLRNDYFDPRILYASAEFNLALEEWVEKYHGVAMRSLDPQFAQAREQVRKIFRANVGSVAELSKQWDESFVGQLPRPPGATASGGRVPTKKRKPPPADLGIKEERSISWRHVALFAGLLLVILWAAPSVLSWYRTQERDLQSLPRSETAEISSLLRSGSWAGSGQKRIFIGHLDADQWNRLDRDERRSEAQTMRQNLEHRQVYTGFVYLNEVLSVSIVDGQLRLVE